MLFVGVCKMINAKTDRLVAKLLPVASVVVETAWLSGVRDLVLLQPLAIHQFG